MSLPTEPFQQSTAHQSVVVLDACILISNVLRFICLGLARAGAYTPAWSAIIGDEWARNASRLWQVPVADLHQDWGAWQQEFPLADQGNVQAYKAGLKYSDHKDWHVIAAARAAQVAFPHSTVHILTKNLKDFNRSELKRLGLTLLPPDTFLEQMFVMHPTVMLSLLEQLPEAVKSPTKPALEVQELLKRERLFCLNRSYQQVLAAKGKE